MNREFISAAQRELANLKAEVKNDPRYLKIQRLEELLAMYGPPVEPAIDSKPASRRFTPKPVAGAETKAAAMLQAITGLLEPGTVHRTKILAHLQERGIMGGEVNPMRQLAAFLSVHRDRFEPDGKGNFRLRGTATAKPKEETERDTGWSLLEPAGHEIGA